jgi:hypothetical protein
MRILGELPFQVLELIEIQPVFLKCLLGSLALQAIRELLELRVGLIHLIE